jgi:hypothetical protein
MYRSRPLSDVTYEQESQLRQVILCFVQAVADRGGSLPKIKLVKMLYLLDLEAFKRRGVPATGLDWQFFHYGPYTATLEPVLERAEGSYFERLELPRQQSHRWAALASQLSRTQVPVENEVVYLYKPLYGLPDEPIADSFVAQLAQFVSQRWAAADTDAILRHVYATEPVARGRRYEPIDWNLAPREPGIFGNHARHFLIPEAVRESVDAAWATWRETSGDVWAEHQPERWLFDERWAAAVKRMDEDESAPVRWDIRIRGALPQPQGPDD